MVQARCCCTLSRGSAGLVGRCALSSRQRTAKRGVFRRLAVDPGSMGSAAVVTRPWARLLKPSQLTPTSRATMAARTVNARTARDRPCEDQTDDDPCAIITTVAVPGHHLEENPPESLGQGGIAGQIPSIQGRGTEAVSGANSDFTASGSGRTASCIRSCRHLLSCDPPARARGFASAPAG